MQTIVDSKRLGRLKINVTEVVKNKNSYKVQIFSINGVEIKLSELTKTEAEKLDIEIRKLYIV